MFEEKVVKGVLCRKLKKTGEWKPLSSRQLTKRLLNLRRINAIKIVDALKVDSTPNIHRCVRCGSTSTVVDELASHPAYGC